MTGYQSVTLQLNKNLQILRERKAKYGADNAPLDLLNQIADHEQAITLPAEFAPANNQSTQQTGD